MARFVISGSGMNRASPVEWQLIRADRAGGPTANPCPSRFRIELASTGPAALLLTATAIVAGCGDGSGDASCVACEDGRCTYAHEFPVVDIAAGEERNRVCVSWTIDNPTDVWVDAQGGQVPECGWLAPGQGVVAEVEGLESD